MSYRKINLDCQFSDFQLIDGLRKIYKECLKKNKVRIRKKIPSDTTFIGRRPEAFAYLNCFRQKLEEDKMCKNCLVTKYLMKIEFIAACHIPSA